jgi:hypothetical protein
MAGKSQYSKDMKQAGGGTSADHVSVQDAKMGDITTAASSSMAPADYSRGFPPNEGELLNQNFASRGNKGAPPRGESRG